jgi:hypothetical protein
MHQLGGCIHQKVELKNQESRTGKQDDRGKQRKAGQESRGKQDRKAEESRTDGNDPNANALE